MPNYDQFNNQLFMKYERNSTTMIMRIILPMITAITGNTYDGRKLSKADKHS